MRRLMSLCCSGKLHACSASHQPTAAVSTTLRHRNPARISWLCSYSTLSHAFSAALQLQPSSLPSRLSVSPSRCSPSSLPALAPPSLFCLPVRFATKKAGGSVKNKRDSPGRRLGLKTAGGSQVRVGSILVRQRGLQTHPGRGVGVGRDHTLFARRAGEVVFTYLLRPYRRRRKWRKLINIIDRQQGEGEQELADGVAIMQAEYLQVLKMKRQGVRVPTVRSVYLAEVETEKRLEARKATESMIARVTAQQQQQLEEQRPAALLS
jgi:large subunit ribosomal protein L27